MLQLCGMSVLGPSEKCQWSVVLLNAVMYGSSTDNTVFFMIIEQTA